MSGWFTAASVTAAAAATATVGFLYYCYLFDKKRRSDPEYKKKVLAKRRRANEPTNPFAKYNMTMASSLDQRHKFFMSQMQIGEEMIVIGKFEQAAEHLSNALVFSPNPQQMIHLFQTRLPPILTERIAELFETKVKQLGDYTEFLAAACSENTATSSVSKAAEPIIIDVD